MLSVHQWAPVVGERGGRVTANTRVSFLIRGTTALGTTVADEAFGRCLVAVDPNFMQGSQGVLNIVIWIPVTSLTAI